MAALRHHPQPARSRASGSSSCHGWCSMPHGAPQQTQQHHRQARCRCCDSSGRFDGARLLELEELLPAMSLEQLAATGDRLRQACRAAEAGAQLEFFSSELPAKTWLLTYRAAVAERLQLAQPQEQQQHQQQHSGSGDALEGGTPQPAAAGGTDATPEHLAAVLACLAALPIPVVQPLPIGFGTPRWSRPLAAADPAAWEQWLAGVAQAWAACATQQHLQQDALTQQLADVVTALACSMRWANVNVDADEVQTPRFRAKVLACLRQQQDEELQQQQQQQPSGHPLALGHRLTLTLLMLLLPVPRPLLAAFFSATTPLAFSLTQLQAIVRGCLCVGAAPPEAWLHDLVGLVRQQSAAGLAQRDVLSWVEAFRFFGSHSRRVQPWLRDATALLEEFSCGGV